MSNDLSHPIRVYSITLAAGERRPVAHGRAVAFHLPIQRAPKDVPADSLLVSFGEHADELPVTEGVFISAPGDGEGWKVTTFRNSSAGAITFDYVLSNDPALLILKGA